MSQISEGKAAIGRMYNPDSKTDPKMILYPETISSQVKHMDGDITDVLPTPKEKATLSNLVPTEAGMIKLFAGDGLPETYLWANGESYFKIEKAALFKTIGTKFGESIDKKKFSVPRLAPVSVTGVGTDYVLDRIRIDGGNTSYQYYVEYCDDKKGDPFWYLFMVQLGYHFKVYTSDHRVEQSLVPIPASLGVTAGQFDYCPFNNKLHTRQSTSFLWRRELFATTEEKLSLTPPAGWSGFSVDPTNGDVYLLVTPGAMVGISLWKWTNATSELTMIKDLSDQVKSNSAATWRQMKYDPIDQVIYFQLSHTTSSGTPNNYSMCTYHLKTDQVYQGTAIETWYQNFVYTCGKMWISKDPSMPIQPIDNRGIITSRTTQLPLIVSNGITIPNTVAYAPNGIPLWTFGITGTGNIHSFVLDDVFTGQDLYYIIKE